MSASPEIGSEFALSHEENGSGIGFPKVRSSALVFSGRTALEVIAQTADVHGIALPSYCCDSMIEPFRRSGADIYFYDVYFDGNLKTELVIPDGADAVLWCSYFGFRRQMPDLSAFKARGGIIIEDITHSLLSREQFHPQSDFLAASVRKWLPVLCGGWCAGADTELKNIPKGTVPEDHLSAKKTAMSLKAEYLVSHDEAEKPRFLELYSRANKLLAERYSGIRIDELSENIISHADAENIRQARRRNAKTLYEGLSEIGYIEPMFGIDDMDCPLFLPVVIDKDKRDKVRQHLTDERIYCPVHWGKPNADCRSELYDTELSLICDQRYTEEDMKRIISVLKDFPH